MTFEYVTIEEAMQRRGLRMIVVGDVPSPWGEAAKGLFHIKRLDFAAVRLAYDNEAMKAWCPQRNGPVVVYEDERPRSGWAEILLLAERLAQAPSLLPNDAAQRALAFGLAHELLGEQGLAWSRRLQLIHAGIHGHGGFPERVARYLAKKYGYSGESGTASALRVAQLLMMLVTRLKAQRKAGSRYYIGDAVTAVDVYSATCMAMFQPLSPENCAMDPATRAAFEMRNAQVDAALEPILLDHRDMMYAEHLALPLSL